MLVRYDAGNRQMLSPYLKVGRNRSCLIVLDAQGRERARLSNLDRIVTLDPIREFLARNSKLRRLGQDDPPGSPSDEQEQPRER